MSGFSWPVRIYWEATDAAGMVYHGAYPGIFEQARVEWMRHLGFDQAHRDGNVTGFFAVKCLQIDYKRPLLLDQQVVVTCCVSSSGASRLILAQNTMHEGQQMAEAMVSLAWLDAMRKKPIRMPSNLKQKLQEQ